MPSIVPSILENSFEKFAEILEKIDGLTPLIEIDVMDGIFVPNKSFQDVERLNDLNPKSKFQLHLMVDDALGEIERWKDIKNVAKIIFHIETSSNPHKCISAIREQNREVGIAIKLDTPLDAITPYFGIIDELLFMTVNPGRQGGKFLPEVGDKIKAFNFFANQPVNQFRDKPRIGVDGGINKDTIAVASSWGVEIFGVGSAIAKTEDPKKSYEELKSLIA